MNKIDEVMTLKDLLSRIKMYNIPLSTKITVYSYEGLEGRVNITDFRYNEKDMSIILCPSRDLS